jgi:diguanylate cyclase (GGDEF)-like protein
MSEDSVHGVTEADWTHVRADVRRIKYVMLLVALVVLPAMTLPAVVLADHTAHGSARPPVAAGWALILLAPLIFAVLRISLAQQARSDGTVAALTQRLSVAVATADRDAGERDVSARRQQFESRLANALDMAEGEPEVIDVIERSFTSTLADAPVELLLADNSHAHLMRMASSTGSSPDPGRTPGCGVDSPDHCPAARRAQVQRFADSEALDACPKLRGRGPEAVSALCVPVSIMGRTVGVIHATGDVGATFADEEVQDLGTLAKLAGARIGLLRVMAETQLQAATDSLTGLLNRRSFEHKLTAARAGIATVAVAMADLDHFKELNDTYGHDTGDRALRLFAQALCESVRAQDLLGRHGGEEFVVALPACPVAKARDVLDAFRARLDAAITVAGLPHFTVSFGLVDAGEREALPDVLARADAALFEAKRAGRNQVVVHDAAGHAVPTPAAAGL